MKAQTTITITSKEITEQEGKILEDFLNSEALLEAAKENIRKTIKKTINDAEDIEINIKKVETNQ